MKGGCFGKKDSGMDELQALKLQAGEGWVEFWIRVQPKASSNEMCGMVQGELKLKIKAPPLEGKANRAAQEFLGEVLDVAKGKVEIVSGKASRSKKVRVWGLKPQELLQRLKGTTGG
ncbi:MAG: DUF167 domain-containing protein [bacterium]